MLVKQLKEYIEETVEEYGKEVEDWDIYIELVTGEDLEEKRKGDLKIVKDFEDWEYIETRGFVTKMPDEKILTINCNY